MNKIHFFPQIINFIYYASEEQTDIAPVLEADRVHKTVSSLSQIWICFFLKCSRIPPIWEFKIYNNGKTQTLPQMLKEARPMTKYQPQRIQSVYKWISVGLMLLSMRRPAASDSTKCVQSKWLSSPILGWKLLPVHAQAESIDHDRFRDLYTFFFNLNSV